MYSIEEGINSITAMDGGQTFGLNYPGYGFTKLYSEVFAEPINKNLPDANEQLVKRIDYYITWHLCPYYEEGKEKDFDEYNLYVRAPGNIGLYKYFRGFVNEEAMKAMLHSVITLLNEGLKLNFKTDAVVDYFVLNKNKNVIVTTGIKRAV